MIVYIFFVEEYGQVPDSVSILIRSAVIVPVVAQIASENSAAELVVDLLARVPGGSILRTDAALSPKLIEEDAGRQYHLQCAILSWLAARGLCFWEPEAAQGRAGRGQYCPPLLGDEGGLSLAGVQAMQLYFLGHYHRMAVYAAANGYGFIPGRGVQGLLKIAVVAALRADPDLGQAGQRKQEHH